MKLLREIGSYAMFIWILAIISYTNKDTNSYNYQLVIKNSLAKGSVELNQVVGCCLENNFRQMALMIIFFNFRYTVFPTFGIGPIKC